MPPKAISAASVTKSPPPGLVRVLGKEPSPLQTTPLNHQPRRLLQVMERRKKRVEMKIEKERVTSMQIDLVFLKFSLI